MTKNELAKKLQEAGFPTITKWEIENNYRRTISVSGELTLPPLGAIASEIKVPFGLERSGENYYSAYHMYMEDFLSDEEVEKNAKYQKTECDRDVYNMNEGSYRDDRISELCYSRTPEEALAKLYIALKK